MGNIEIILEDLDKEVIDKLVFESLDLSNVKIISSNFN